MRVPIGTAAAELIVKRSRFIGGASFFDAPEDTKSTIREVRDLHPGCNHVVYAYVIGSAGTVYGMSDDGEPKNTAGRPALEVVKGSGITNVLVTIVRFFGGNKLGTGGLVRAYSDTAKAVLSRLKTEELVERVRFSFSVPYQCYEGSRRLVVELSGSIESEDFTESVLLSGQIPSENRESLALGLADLTSGAVTPEFSYMP